jgi:ubiquinone/menaquinone biosynthesis C-methylase UbiE
MLRAARSSLDELSSAHVTFRQGDAQDLSWAEPCAFDGVLCSSVVEYLDDQDKLLHQVSRVLKNNGVLIISVPPKGSLVRTAQKVLRRLLKLVGCNDMLIWRFLVSRLSHALSSPGSGMQICT